MSIGEAVLIVIGAVVIVLVVLDWLEKRRQTRATIVTGPQSTLQSRADQTINPLVYTQTDMDQMRDLWSSTIAEYRAENAELRRELAIIRHDQSELIRDALVPKTTDLTALTLDEFEDGGPDLPDGEPDWTDDIIPDTLDEIPPPPFATP